MLVRYACRFAINQLYMAHCVITKFIDCAASLVLFRVNGLCANGIGPNDFRRNFSWGMVVNLAPIFTLTAYSIVPPFSEKTTWRVRAFEIPPRQLIRHP